MISRDCPEVTIVGWGRTARRPYGSRPRGYAREPGRARAEAQVPRRPAAASSSARWIDLLGDRGPFVGVDSLGPGATVAAVASEARAGTGQISPSPTTFLFSPWKVAPRALHCPTLYSRSRALSRPLAQFRAEVEAETQGVLRRVPREVLAQIAPRVRRLWLALCRQRMATGRAARRRPFPSDRATASGGQSYGFARYTSSSTVPPSPRVSAQTRDGLPLRSVETHM